MKPSIYSLENQTKHVLGIAVLIHSCVASFLITHFMVMFNDFDSLSKTLRGTKLNIISKIDD